MARDKFDRYRVSDTHSKFLARPWFRSGWLLLALSVALFLAGAVGTYAIEALIDLLIAAETDTAAWVRFAGLAGTAVVAGVVAGLLFRHRASKVEANAVFQLLVDTPHVSAQGYRAIVSDNVGGQRFIAEPVVVTTGSDAAPSALAPAVRALNRLDEAIDVYVVATPFVAVHGTHAAAHMALGYGSRLALDAVITEFGDSQIAQKGGRLGSSVYIVYGDLEWTRKGTEWLGLSRAAVDDFTQAASVVEPGVTEIHVAYTCVKNEDIPRWDPRRVFTAPNGKAPQLDAAFGYRWQDGLVPEESLGSARGGVVWGPVTATPFERYEPVRTDDGDDVTPTEEHRLQKDLTIAEASVVYGSCAKDLAVFMLMTLHRWPDAAVNVTVRAPRSVTFAAGVILARALGKQHLLPSTSAERLRVWAKDRTVLSPDGSGTTLGFGPYALT